eukprot:CFRG2451T1
MQRLGSRSLSITSPPTLRLLIGGNLVSSETTFPVINPATGKEIIQCPAASDQQLNDAVSSAKSAFESFRSYSIQDRQAMLNAASDALAEHRERLAYWLTLEQGKSLAAAEWEVDAAIDQFKVNHNVSVLDNKVLRDTATERAQIVYKPLGVVGAIAPWNYPLFISAIKVSTSVLTGNTVVFKSSPYTPVTALMMGEIINDAFPKGVVNILSGDNDLGAKLVSHPNIAKVSFTGSIATGKAIQKSCADMMKRCTLELGGNDPAIVLLDADLDKAVPGIFNTAFENTGQVCCAIKRVYVPRDMHAEFCERLVKLAKEAKVGNGLDEGVAFGPLNNSMQFKKVADLLEDTIEQGAKVLCGGMPEDRSGESGYLFPLTVVSGVKDTSRIVAEEQFGPVLPILSYDTEEEAIERANDTRFGLGASVWGKDLDHASDISLRLESGMTWVNQHLNTPPTDPFGGCKESGVGREGGSSGLLAYVEEQVQILKK